MSTYVSTDFSYPRQILGSGQREFSIFNTIDFTVSRDYVQEKNSYKPLPLNTRDSQYKNALLIEEQELKRDGYLVYFKRLYATIPSTRFEHRSTLFTFPGRSGFLSSKAWDRYASARPATVGRESLVTVSYSLGEPLTQVPTQITLAGTPVDYTGSVYTDDGKTFIGMTDPLISPSVWVISDVAKRWRGNIWERELVTVAEAGGAGSSFGG